MTFIPRLIVIGLLLASIVVVFSRIEVAERLDRHLLFAILAAQLPLALSQLCLAQRFRMAIGLPAVSFKVCLWASLLGQAVDLIVPWRLSELVRVFYVREQAAVPFTSGFSAVLMERAADLVVLGTLALTAASFAIVETSVATFVVPAATIVGGLLILPAIAPWLERAIKYLPFGMVQELAQKLLGELLRRLRDRTLWRILAPTAATWSSAIAGTWTLLAVAQLRIDGQALPITAGLVLALFVATSIGSAVAVLPAGFGTYEAAVVIVLAAYRVTFDDALAIAIALHLGNMLLGALGGAAVAALARVVCRRGQAGAEGAALIWIVRFRICCGADSVPGALGGAFNAFVLPIGLNIVVPGRKELYGKRRANRNRMLFGSISTASLMLQFCGSVVTSDTGLLAYRRTSLPSCRPVWPVESSSCPPPPRGIVLDMDLSVSPTHGEEMSVWNGHYACAGYHPLFVFNQFGDRTLRLKVPASARVGTLEDHHPGCRTAPRRDGRTLRDRWADERDNLPRIRRTMSGSNARPP